MAQAGGASSEGIVRYTGVFDCFIRMPQVAPSQCAVDDER